MAQTVEREVKLILSDINELLEREEELTQNENLLVMYSYDWINSLVRVEKDWDIFTSDQQVLITQKFEEVKPIALKLKLPWPEELSK